MKKLLYLILCLSAFTASAVDVVWNFADFVTAAHATRRVVITPISPWGTNSSLIITGDRKTYTNTVGGQLQVSNIVAGYSYRVEFFGPFAVTAITNSFDSSLTGYVDGKDYIGIPLVNSGTVAYSQAASDSRYIRTNLIKNYILLGTNMAFVTNASGTMTIHSTATGSGSEGSATNVFFIAGQSTTPRTIGGSNAVDVVGTLTNSTTGNAATATTASNVTAGVTNLILNQRNGLLPPQLPSSIFNDWSSGTLLLTNGTIALEDTHLSEASIGSIGDKLGLFYSSYDAGSTGRIFAAYGTLLNGFTKHGVVLAPTVASWDSGLIGGATHYREGRTNYLYYFGGTNFGAFEAEPTHIGVAYSTDGTNFTKYASNPIMQTTDITEGNCITLYTWFTKKVGLTYYGFFNAKHSSGTATEKVHLATAANPLGPWTYYGEIYRHTNASVTSDFTVADLPGGGYIAAYWVITNGFALSQSAYSDDLITWRHVARLNNTALVGTRLFYDDGIVLSYCVDQTSVYYTRPKRSYMGDFSAGIISASIVSGDGSGLTGVGANSLVDFQAATSGDDLSLIADIPGTVADPNYWTYNLSSLRWRTTGGIIAGSGFIGSAAGLSNAPSGLFPGIIISTNTGSAINAVGITNGNVTIPGTLGVTGATTMGTLVGTTISGNGSGLSNAVDIIAGDGSVTIVTNANKRSFTITAAGGGGGGWTGNPNQFTGGSTTNIKNGVLLTNAVNYIDDETAFLRDANAGELMSYDSDNDDMRVNAGLLWTGQARGDGRNITNLNAAYISGDLSVSNLTATTLIADSFVGNGSGLTNVELSVSTVFVRDDFFKGVGTGATGDLGWSAMPGTSLFRNSVADATQWGVTQIESPATSGTGYGLYLSASGGVYGGTLPISTRTNWTATFIFRTLSTNVVGHGVGFYIPSASWSPTANQIAARYDTSLGDTTWKFVTRAAGVATTNDLGVSPQSDKWHTLTIASFVSGEIVSKMDSGAWVTNSSNVGGVHTPFISVLPREAVSKTNMIDFFEFKATR